MGTHGRSSLLLYPPPLCKNCIGQFTRVSIMKVFPAVVARKSADVENGHLIQMELYSESHNDRRPRFCLAMAFKTDSEPHPGFMVFGDDEDQTGAWFEGRSHGDVLDFGDNWQIEPELGRDSVIFDEDHATHGSLLIGSDGPVGVYAKAKNFQRLFYRFDTKLVSPEAPAFTISVKKWKIVLRDGSWRHELVAVTAKYSRPAG